MIEVTAAVILASTLCLIVGEASSTADVEAAIENKEWIIPVVAAPFDLQERAQWTGTLQVSAAYVAYLAYTAMACILQSQVDPVHPHLSLERSHIHPYLSLERSHTHHIHVNCQ